MLECFNVCLFLVDYYYYDFPTEIPAQDVDLTLDDWLYELMDFKGKRPLTPPIGKIDEIASFC